MRSPLESEEREVGRPRVVVGEGAQIAEDVIDMLGYLMCGWRVLSWLTRGAGRRSRCSVVLVEAGLLLGTSNKRDEEGRG